MYYNNTISTYVCTYNNIYGEGSIPICMQFFKIFLATTLVSIVLEGVQVVQYGIYVHIRSHPTMYP